MEEVDIRVNGMGIGKVRLDPAEIWGEGGEYNPRLVIPIKIELYQQPLDHQIVIIRFSASLHLAQHPSHSNQFASKMNYDTMYNMPLRSVTNGSSASGLDLCFNLTHAQLKTLEVMRHEPGRNLYLSLEPIIVWNKHTGNSQGVFGGVSTLGEHGWDVNGVNPFCRTEGKVNFCPTRRRWPQIQQVDDTPGSSGAASHYTPAR